MKKYLILIIVTGVAVTGCDKKSTEMDDIPPVIDLTIPGVFPVQCSEITRGETFVFRAKFTDNAALGSYGLDIHHNFDQHSHSTETGTCEAGEIKPPVSPFLLVRSYSIPEGNTSFEATASIEVPAGVDTGDYHFMIKVTDKQGWQTIKGLSIKIK
ncbi:MAG: DUF4625 domain-containing protein [Chitinophagaceae bacterium]|nr:DUF4625 domain-containing protein [Chitinophagaceae bacterium]MCW5925339.1 DUF4625 domain-containing protein [Chitinophagaceae bacterium]